MATASTKSAASPKSTKPNAKKKSVKKQVKPEAADTTSIDENAVIRKLADNSRPVREKALQVVKRYVASKKTLDLFKLQKLWKGMFYAMWHCDRPITQQNLAAEMAEITHNVNPKNYWTFIEAFWTIMIREWTSIDSHRINKFYLLIRRYLHAIFVKLQSENWAEDWLAAFFESLQKGALETSDGKIPHALRLHVCDIYVDEIERVLGDDEPTTVPIDELLGPIKELAQEAKFKIVKQRAKEVLDDERLYAWGVLEKPVAVVEESEDEWDGFD